ncbi:MAG: tRNA (adenosine(37)-N6)-threonylcarbamoyltransferase complex dimerization subunit type 1 TsaB [Candidatus Doudnabacteria bacterium]|nr:tRNA (adenosine(37)-N6)-threonylcarbamoyltransferase complex dimerization subunit type 1 TsaB [Candidatus Doudnabacteria bacterium]
MILFIDTTDNDFVRIGLVRNSKFITKQWQTRKLSETLMLEIKKFLSRQKVNFQDIKRIVVVVGPGFFSRTRTGVATANALAFALAIPVAGIKQNQIPKDPLKFNRLKYKNSVLPYYEKAPNITKPKRR